MVSNNKIIFKIFRVFVLFFLIFNRLIFCALEVDSKKVAEPTKVFLGILNSELNSIGPLMSKALSSTDSFSVSIKRNFKLTNNKQIKDLFYNGFCLAIFLSENKADKSFIECRIYDPAEGKMIKGIKVKKMNSIPDTVYNITDKIWTSLTLEKSSFCSKIAYIQNQINTKNSKNNNSNCSIFICDYNGQNKKKILHSNNNYLGLYWSNNLNEPALFCSEFTKFNVRLVSISLFNSINNIKNKSFLKSTIWDFNGTCVGISLSPDKNQAVYCRSGDIWYYKFDRDKKKGEHIKLISNDGKNIYPILLPNGDLVFCSDSKQLSNNQNNLSSYTPRICYYNSKSKKVDLITNSGYSISPTYCHLNNKLAYSKRVDNFFQLFIYDFSSKQHEQITFDKSNKIDASWSPCGNFLVFCYKLSNLSKICIIKLDTKKQKFITNSKDCCSSPSWSPIYNSFLL